MDAGFCGSVVQASFIDSAAGRFFIDGAPHTFKDYMETAVPEDVRKRVQRIAPPPARRIAGTFSGATNKTQERKTGMDEKDMLITDVAGLKAAYPQLCAQIGAEAVEAERERLRAIDEIAAGIPGDLLAKAKYEEPISAADLALAQMKANNAAGQQFLAGMVADMQDSGTATVPADPNVGSDDTIRQKEESEKKVGGLAAMLKNDKRRG